MDTTSTSDKKHARFLLRLRDIDSNQTFDLNLYRGSAAKGELNIVDSTVVHSSHRYSMFLLANREIVARDGFFDINCETEEPVTLNPIKGIFNEDNSDEWRYYQLVFNNGKQTLFSMVFGLARIRLTIVEEGGLVTLETFDLPCACDREDYRFIVSGMLDELIDTEDRQCIDWMFSPVKFEQEKASMVESALVESSSRSLKSLVELARNTMKTYKRHFDYFALHGHCRTMSKEALVNPNSVRKLGRSELVWLAQNPGQLYESNRKTALYRNGKYYMANRIQTERRHKSYDNLENRALVAFADEICRILSRAISDVEARIDLFLKTRRNLEKANVDGALLPTLVLIDTYLNKENPIIDEAKTIQGKFRDIRERLLKSFPDVLEVQYVLPRRTKVFQEIVPYADIHADMREWNAFGRVDTLRDALALHTWRIDKLYEYYVLFKLLQQLRNYGFCPDGELNSAIQQGKYSIEDSDAVFRNDEQVANIYSLNRGGEQVTLYYQPVFYGDEREEHGVELHRTTASRIHPYWTPDYLIKHKREGKVTHIVIDAKFRSKTLVHWNNTRLKGNESRSDLTNSAFLDCILKYKVATCGANGAKVDAMWILYGRETEERTHVYQYSKWARANYGELFDGIAPLSPQIDCVAEMMNRIGISEQSTQKGSAKDNTEVKTDEEESGQEQVEHTQATPETLTNRRNETNQLDTILELIGQLESKLYNPDLLFDARYAQRHLGLSHSILKRKQATGYEAKQYSSQLIEIGNLSGYVYTRWRPNNLNKLKQLVRKTVR